MRSHEPRDDSKLTLVRIILTGTTRHGNKTKQEVKINTGQGGRRQPEAKRRILPGTENPEQSQGRQSP